MIYAKQILNNAIQIILNLSTLRNIKKKSNCRMSSGKSKKLVQVPQLDRKVLRKVNSYNPDTKRCNLCLNENLKIVLYNDK